MTDYLRSKLSNMFRGHNAFMMLCCLAMGAAVVAALAQGQTIGALLPLVLCLGMHLVMHKVMGKSCHEKQKEPEGEARPVSVPQRTASAPGKLMIDHADAAPGK